MNTITVSSLVPILKKPLPADTLLLDVRSPEEFHTEHLPQATNIPKEQVAHSREFLEQFSRIYVYCASGRRSSDACSVINSMGLSQVHNLEGGILQWKHEGQHVIKKRGRMPIIQQVHTIAGSLILLGVLLGFVVHPWWVLLSATIGAGLLFAGLTGFCGMATLLRYMPWNKVR